MSERNWADLEKRAQEKLEQQQIEDMIEQDIKTQYEVEAQLHVAPMFMIVYLKEIRDLLVILTNEIKVANSQVLEDYELELVEPNEIGLPSIIREAPDEEEIENATVKVQKPNGDKLDYKPNFEDEQAVVDFYKDKLENYEDSNGKMFTDEELGKFQFGVGENNVIMKYDGWIKDFATFARFVENKLGGKYETKKGFILPLP
jgi:hypothetical protein